MYVEFSIALVSLIPNNLYLDKMEKHAHQAAKKILLRRVQ